MIRKAAIPLLILFLVVPLFSHPLFSQKNIKETPGNNGKRWAICIGVDEYKDKRIVGLNDSRKDAAMLAELLKKNGQFDNVYLMTDDLNADSEDFPKKSNILQKMNKLKALIKPEDLVVFFFSGHGVSNASGEGFLILSNSYRENLNGTSFRIKDVVLWLNEMGVKKSLLLLDAGREKFLLGKDLKQNVVPFEDFGQEQVGAVFYAATAGSFGYSEGGFGLFARFVGDGLAGKADENGDKLVSFSELGTYVKNSLGKWASANGKNQQPNIKIYNQQLDGLALSSFDKADGVQLASTASSAVNLRAVYKLLKGNSVLTFIKKYGFFDAKLNPNRTFVNQFESQTINGDKVVVDKATGLMWHPGGSEKGMEMNSAKDWLTTLNQQKYAGANDWRLPTLVEAASLVQGSKTNGNLYVDPLFSAVQINMWTGDLSGNEAGWVVHFDLGKINRDYFFNYFFIRPVRTIR